MSERAKALHAAIQSVDPSFFAEDAQAVARYLCEHVGVTWALVERLLEQYARRGLLCDKEAADAIATLLEAAGIER